MKNFTTIYLLLLCFAMIHPVRSYATAWTTATAGPVTTLTNWKNGSTSPTTFATPGDTWTVSLPMTLPAGSAWTVGTSASTPSPVTIVTGGIIYYSGSGSTPTITIYGDLIISGGTLSISGIGAIENLNVYGNYTMSAGLLKASGNSPIINMNIHGNYSMTGGADSISGTSSYLYVNTYGNFNMNSGSFYVSGSTSDFIDTIYGNCDITGTASMMNLSSGANSLYMAIPSASGTMLMSNVSIGAWQKTNFYVDAGSAAQLDGNFGMGLGTSSSNSSLVADGELICPAPYAVNGDIAFTLSGTGTLKVANAAGINGNITTTGTKTFNTAANYVFNGSVPQTTGSLLPASLVSPDTISISNSAGVTLSQSTATTGTLLFTSGPLHTGTCTITTPGAAAGVVGAGPSSYVDGTLTKTITGISVVNYEVGDVDYAPMNLTLSAAGTAGSLGIRCNHGLHPNVGTSGILTSDIVNHYWSISNNSASGPFSVIPKATYNFSDIIGGSNTSFVIQEYAGSAWLTSPFVTTNTSSPYTSVPTTGLTLGVLPGAYIYGNGCGTPIIGTTHICSTGATTTLSNATSGGTWSSSNAAIASVGISTGIVTGVSAGTAVIFYNTSSCSVSAVVTVGVPAITGATTICPLSGSALSDATPGGTWGSSNTAVATISATGEVYGISGGTTNISYTIGSCAPAVVAVTVAALAPITGNSSLCTGGTNTLNDATTGGVWSSNNTSVATVSGTGVVYGVSTFGTATISYTVGSCSAAFVVTDATISSITGIDTLCGTTTTTLSDGAMWAGGIWSSSNTGIATVSAAGVVSALSTTTLTTAIITYTYGSCSITTSVTVNANNPISGPTVVCVGSVINISDAVAGGTWSSTNTALATVGAAGGLGYVTGVSSTTPSPRVIYTLPTGCTETIIITVSSTPAITGSTVVCAGSTITLHDAVAFGIWSSSNSTVATVTPGPAGGGIVTGVSPGTTNISYTSTPGGCSTTATLTVLPLPSAITNSNPACVGSTISLSDATAGGAWSSGNPATATVGTGTGIVSGVTGGTATISYSISGCITTTTVLINGPQVPQVCVVYEDSTSGKNLVVWDQFVPNRTAWFNVYRENSSSVFVKIDSQASNMFSTYLDTGSYPLLQSYSYQLTATDSCGNESPLGSSTAHTTVHLSANLGVGGAVNLIWNTYIGKPVTTQDIMRSVGGAPFVNIASVANSVTSYTDATPPSGSLVYEINSVMASGCTPSARTTAYDVVSSNPVYIGATGINTINYDPEIDIPNPTSTSLTIKSTESITNITISNIVGERVYTREYNTKQLQVDVSGFASGVYFVKVNGVEVRKFVKE